VGEETDGTKGLEQDRAPLLKAEAQWIEDEHDDEDEHESLASEFVPKDVQIVADDRERPSRVVAELESCKGRSSKSSASPWATTASMVQY
jgi:Lon protease-like protein